MAKQDLNIGATPNDGTGDPLRDAMDKVNDNFGEIYTALGGNTVSNIVTGGVIDYTGSNKLTFLYTDLSDLPAASSYHGMFAHVHNTGAAYYAHAGSWIQLADKSLVDALTINSLTDVDTATNAPTDGQVLAWSASGSKWVPAADAGGIAFADLSVTVGSAGTANLAYNSASGAFTYTPPDLSGYQLSSGLATVATTGQYTDLLSTPTIPSLLTDLSITDGTNGQVLTTDGSGAFSFTTVSSSGGASAINDLSDVDTSTSAPSNGDVLTWVQADSEWAPAAPSGGGGATTWASITDINNASGPNKIAIGSNATAGLEAIAIGKGTAGVGDYAQAIGNNAGNTGQGVAAVALGSQSGETSQGDKAVAVGQYAGQTSQGASAVAIGDEAGKTSQSGGAVAIGDEAGNDTQGGQAVAIGSYAGYANQGIKAIAIGIEAGESYQATNAVAVGNSSGTNLQEANSIAIGVQAGQNVQGQSAVAIGEQAGEGSTYQKTYVSHAGTNLELNNTTNLIVGAKISNTQGVTAGTEITAIVDGTNVTLNQGLTGTPAASGVNFHQNGQGDQAIAIGKQAGETTQGEDAVAVGNAAGFLNQGQEATAIGPGAGITNQGANALALGVNAGRTSQAANSIAINATSGILENTTPDSFVVKPIRNASGTHSMEYNPTTGEVTYDTLGGGGTDTVIAPFAIARVNGTSGTGTDISYGSWNAGSATLTFTFTNAQANTDYIVVTDGEGFDDGRLASVSNKTTTGFDVSLYDGSGNPLTPTSGNQFAIIVYGETPTVTITGSNISNASIGILSDVAISSPTNGQVLKYNGSNWINDTDAGGGGTFGIAGNTGTHTFDTSTETLTFLGTTGQINAGIAANNVTLELDSNINSIQSIAFEGATADNFETTVSAVDPTADRTIQLPDASGTVLLVGQEAQSLDDVITLGNTTSQAVTINNTLTVTSIDSTGVGFANLVSASDIVLNATGDINASSSKVTNVLDPTSAQDAATKAYVDTNVATAGSPTFSVTAPNSGIYRYTGDGFPGPEDNPTLFLYKGFTYTFNLSVSGHPFHIQTSAGGYNASNVYTAGVTNPGAQTGTMTFTVPMSAPNTLYYVCQYHSAMNGTITIL